MKLLRETVRMIILESLARDEFRNMWFDRSPPVHYNKDNLAPISGTYHKDMLRQRKVKKKKLSPEQAIAYTDELFNDKRDIKRQWNELVDRHGARSFWQGPKMQYFHSLSYYGKNSSSDTLQQTVELEGNLADISVDAFMNTYSLSGNKDEMSTYGVHKGKSAASRDERKLGFLLRGRVTLASSNDAYVESRSKGTAIDMERHKSSGLPKRPMPTDLRYGVLNLLFDESDIPVKGPGECVLDNWSVEAIVYNPDFQPSKNVKHIADRYNIKLLTSQGVFK
jgi:hypothetical protein